MKHRFHLTFLLVTLALTGSMPRLCAQTNFSVPWFVVAGGGGTTSNGGFVLTGTFGQWDPTQQPLDGGNFSLTGGFWSLLATNETPFDSLFSDNFANETIDPLKWITSGNTVFQSNDMMVVSNAAIDDGGVLTSVPITMETNEPITISRRVYLHAQPSPDPNYPGPYFMGQFGITVGSLPQFSVYYADFDYADGVTYTNRYGFYLARDGASPIYIADQSNVSPAIPPFWDTPFNETVVYNPTNGMLNYYANDFLAMSFNVGVMPSNSPPTMTMTFNAWGWWTGHEQAFQSLNVTQSPEVSNSAPMIALSGNLAFGGVAVGATSNLTLTISNSGSATLTISGISYPNGFSGALPTNIIAATTNLQVPVTFSPTALTNYGGMITVNSDATGAGNTIAASGYGASGTLNLVVDINGNGSVSPNLNGKPLIAGKSYTVRAIPKSGNLFMGWTGSTNTTKNPLTFVMQTSTLLEASFIPSPFVAVKGSYNGLFTTTNGVTEETAGMLKGLVVGAGGAYSGALLIDGGSHAVSGSFLVSGQASNYIARPARQGGPLTLLMTLDLSNNPPAITGTVAGSNNGALWTADLVANRAGTNVSATYTMVLAPTIFGVPGIPSGYGYLLLTERPSGLSLSGALADGTAVNQNVPVDDTGYIPVYASLYGNTGLVTGWVSLADGMLDGDLDWIKKAAHSGLYTNGFTNMIIAEGGLWTNRSPALALSDGQLNLDGGSLTNPLVYNVTVSSKNVLTKSGSTPTNSLTGNINPKTGLLTITFGNGSGRAVTAGKGAALQATTNAAGYFLGKTNAGSLILTNVTP